MRSNFGHWDISLNLNTILYLQSLFTLSTANRIKCLLATQKILVIEAEDTQGPILNYAAWFLLRNIFRSMMASTMCLIFQQLMTVFENESETCESMSKEKNIKPILNFILEWELAMFVKVLIKHT